MKLSPVQLALLVEALDGPFVPARAEGRSIHKLVWHRLLRETGQFVAITDEGRAYLGMPPVAKPALAVVR